MATLEEIASQAMALTVDLYRGTRGFDGTPDANDRLKATADVIRDWLGGSYPHPQVAELSARLDRMEGQMATLGETIALINERANQLSEVVSSVQTVITDLRERIGAGETIAEEQIRPLEATLAALTTQLQELAANPEEPVPPTPAPDPVPAPEPGPTPEPLGGESRGRSSRR